jgi:hypothetical protein
MDLLNSANSNIKTAISNILPTSDANNNSASGIFKSEPKISAEPAPSGKGFFDTISDTISNLGSSASAAITPSSSSSLGSTSDSPFSNFSLSNYTTGSSEFLESNSLVAKLAFLLLVVFSFFVLLRLFAGLISYFMNDSNFNPTKLINGMINATEYHEFKQNPSDPGNKTIYRSNNENDGIEFTWSSYIFIKDLVNVGHPNLYHVFHKGNYNISATTGMNSPNNAPGLYIDSAANSLVVVMNTYNSMTETMVVPNIPRNKWLNVVIRCQNTKVDVYVNGLIAQSRQLKSVPKQNYGSIHVAANGGFPGFISNLYYYSYALSISEMQRLNNAGPNLTLTQNGGKYEVTAPDYLSLRWYFGGANDQYISP